jgi:NitT/TauT family transport system ATP-binding protein
MAVPAERPRAHAVSVSLRAVRRTFAGGVTAIDEVDLDVGPGEFVAVLGPSGCGKSTLLRAVAGLDPVQGGRVEVGMPGAHSPGRHDLAFLPGRAPAAGRRRDIGTPLELRGVERRQRQRLADDAIAQVGLEEASRRFPAQLSGGMRMRVSLARALVTEPGLLLLDEPFAALDEITRQRLDEQLHALWRRRRMTVLFVTHSLVEAAFLAQRVVVLSRRPARVVGETAVGPELRTTQRTAPTRRAGPHAAVVAAGGRADDRPNASRRAAADPRLPGLQPAVEAATPVRLPLPVAAALAIVLALVEHAGTPGRAAITGQAASPALRLDRIRAGRRSWRACWVERAVFLPMPSQTVPLVAIAPLLVVCLGFGIRPVAVAAFIVSVFPVIVNTVTGIRSVDPALLDLFRLYGASRPARLVKLELPFALPSILAGLRVAAGLAVIGAVVGEFVASYAGDDAGLGMLALTFSRESHTDRLFAAVGLASLLGLAMFSAVNLVSFVALRHWHASAQEQAR